MPFQYHCVVLRAPNADSVQLRRHPFRDLLRRSSCVRQPCGASCAAVLRNGNRGEAVGAQLQARNCDAGNIGDRGDSRRRDTLVSDCTGAWLYGAAAILAVVPVTLVVIFPTNKKLLEPGRDLKSSETQSLLERWGRLHAIRSALSVAASGFFVWAATH